MYKNIPNITIDLLFINWNNYLLIYLSIDLEIISLLEVQII